MAGSRTDSIWLFLAAGAALTTSDSSCRADGPALHLTFTSGLPGLIAPEQPRQVIVRIEEGTQAIQPGTPAAHYRTDGSAAFSTLPLNHIGGQDWSAMLPGFPCGRTLQVYFSAEGDGGAVVLLPETAPAETFGAEVGVLINQPMLETMFEFAWPAGWSATGIWSVTQACAPAGNLVAGCEEGPWAYFGRQSTCNYNIPIGGPHRLDAPEIELPEIPASGRAVLSFCYALETEQHPSFDKAAVYVNGQTRPEWRMADVRPTPGIPDRYWAEAEVDLTEFAGTTVLLSWRFDPVNSLNNSFRGWHLNNVRVIAEVAGCEPPGPCYANCDGSTVDPMLNVDDFTCFVDQFAAAQGLPHEQQVAHYANCDGSTAPPVLDAADFMCFIDAFAAGCR